MEKKKITCPYCGSRKVETLEEERYISAFYHGSYLCKECECLFDEEDIEREELRHQLSPMLDGTSEEAPMEIYFMIPSAEEEACGLSSLEIPHIDKIFELEGDGTIWYHEEGEYEHGKDEFDITGLLWRDIDELELEDLRALVKYIQEKI